MLVLALDKGRTFSRRCSIARWKRRPFLDAPWLTSRTWPGVLVKRCHGIATCGVGEGLENADFVISNFFTRHSAAHFHSAISRLSLWFWSPPSYLQGYT